MRAIRTNRSARSRGIAVAIAMICGGALRAQQSATGPRLPEIPAAERRRLGADARAAVSRLSDPADMRLAQLAALQAGAGDVDEARRTASESGNWYAFGTAAVAQYKRGDLAGAIETTTEAGSVMDRSQALDYLASVLPVDSALQLIQSYEWPKQKVEALSRLARQVSAADSGRALALVRDAIAIARQDTSSWGRYFETDLVELQTELGGFREALLRITDTLSPSERVERAARVASILQRRTDTVSQRVADSLFRVALRTADRITDATREERRARVLWLYLTYIDSASAAIALEETRTEEERVKVLERVPSGGQTRGVIGPEHPGTIAAVTELEASGRYAEAARALRSMVFADPLLFDSSSTYPRRSAFEATVNRAIADASRVSPVFADTIRRDIGQVLPHGQPELARRLVESISSERLRSESMGVVAMRLRWHDRESAMSMAARIPFARDRDSVYVTLAEQPIGSRPDTAIALSRLIENRSLRGVALLTLASRLLLQNPANADRAREIALEGLDMASPLDRPIRGQVLRDLLPVIPYERFVRWAEGQGTPRGRAHAVFALYEAITAR